MKRLIITLLFSFTAINATRSDEGLYAFKKNIDQAKNSSIFLMPCYAITSYNAFNKIPTDIATTQNWLDRKVGKRTNSQKVFDAKSEIENRNSSALMVTNTLMGGLIFGGAMLGVQYARARYTGQPIDFDWTAIMAGFGASYTLICHGSMQSMTKQAQKIIDYNKQD